MQVVIYMKKIITNIFALALLTLVAGCNNTNSKTITSKEDTSSQESIPSSEPSSSSSEDIDDGREIKENKLYTDSGLTVNFQEKGARISSITYEKDGSTKIIAKDGFVVGRCANRIGGAKFTLNGTEYNLTKFSDGNHLHGGGNGGQWQGPFANSNWTKVGQTASTITYTIHSADKDNGYPGNMDMTVKYTLKQSGELSIEYTATSDQDTLCNPTNHLYMTMNGSSNYNDLDLWINADKYTPLQNSLPTGEIANVAGTQYDYSTEKAFDGSKEYDDNYVLNGEGYRKVATMTGKSLGMKVDVYTDRPGLQLYKAGQGQVCLESQMFPDMINRPEFAEYGTTVLKAGEEFYSKTAYCFSPVE